MSSILVKSLCMLYLNLQLVNQASLSSTLVHIIDTWVCGFRRFQLTVFSPSLPVFLRCLEETAIVHSLGGTDLSMYYKFIPDSQEINNI